MRKPSLFVIFFTVFIDLIGFGIVLPLLPNYGDQFGHGFSPTVIGIIVGCLMATYSAMQFLFAASWGRLSDRIGRRPVLLVSTAGAAASYAVFALGSGFTGMTALVLLFASRAVAGICGANITVAQAYIADITPVENRSKRMGLIGMAFGLGFIFGPAIGSYSYKHLGITGPGWVASALCVINFCLAFAILPESRLPSSEHAPQRPRLSQWTHTLSQPKVGMLIWIFFLATFCFTCFETTLTLLVGRNFNLDPKENTGIIGLLFTYCGIVGAFVQGGAIGRMVKRMGEAKLISLSLILVAISLAPLPFIHGSSPLSWGVLVRPEGLPWVLLFIFLGLLSIGSGLARPPVFGMISILTPANEQGATLGVAQGAGSLARVFGPIFASTLFYHVAFLPYVICACIALLAGVYAWESLVKGQRPVSKASVATS
ncbi:MAG: Major facilitator superfamily 1 [Verrucomicrobiales bacterium]|nr:Major facilitator superfamily 1 [Verrucomicrobiales bacterium]